MKPSFAEILCCPQCRGALRLNAGKWEAEEIISGALDCAACEARYPIRDGIPRFQLEPLEGEQARTVANFGKQWRQFSWLDPAYERQFLDWIRPLRPEDFRGKMVLDAGCGKGRHLVWAQKYGAATVVGFDLSDAVEVAYAHTRALPNVHVAQADIYAPPLKPVFDYVYSLGVLHHLPDPEGGFRVLPTLLRRGGAVAIWVYGRENNGWILWLVNPVRRAITSRLGPSGLLAVSWVITAFVLWPLLRLGIAPLGALASKLFYGEYLSYISQFSFRDVRAIVYDHLTPPTAHYLRREEVQRWFETMRLSGVQLAHHNRNSWRGYARRESH